MPVRVDVYLLPTSDRDPVLRWVCRLIEKAFKEGYRIFVRLPGGEWLDRLDELLWTFRPGSFIPHSRVENRQAEPEWLRVWLGREPPEEADLLINLAEGVPKGWKRFGRIAEVVDGARREEGRQKYRCYRKEGAELHLHRLGRL